MFPAIDPPQSSKNFRVDCICAPPRAHMRPAGCMCAPMFAYAPRMRPDVCICAPCAPHVHCICAPRGAYVTFRVSVLKIGGRSPVKYHRWTLIEVLLNSQFIKITLCNLTSLFLFVGFNICLISEPLRSKIPPERVKNVPDDKNIFVVCQKNIEVRLAQFSA